MTDPWIIQLDPLTIMLAILYLVRSSRHEHRVENELSKLRTPEDQLLQGLQQLVLDAARNKPGQPPTP